MHKHITAVAAMHIGFGIFNIVAGLVLFLLLSGIGIFSNDKEAEFVLNIVGGSIATFLIVVSIPGIIGGIGLLKYKNWARILVLIISAIGLLNVPFGTALGIYSIWTIVQDETIKLFNSI